MFNFISSWLFSNTQNYIFPLLCTVNHTGKSEAKVTLPLFCVPVICLLFAFNKRGESTRQMALLSPGIPVHWSGFPGQQQRYPVHACVYREWWMGITRLSQTGLACCPAVSSCLLASSKGPVGTAKPQTIAGTGGLSLVQDN